MRRLGMTLAAPFQLTFDLFCGLMMLLWILYLGSLKLPGKARQRLIDLGDFLGLAYDRVTEACRFRPDR